MNNNSNDQNNQFENDNPYSGQNSQPVDNNPYNSNQSVNDNLYGQSTYNDFQKETPNNDNYYDNNYSNNNYNNMPNYNYTSPQDNSNFQVPFSESSMPGYGLSIGSLVCGICSIVFCCCYGIVGVILGIIAIILSGKSTRLNSGYSSSMAKAGKICGIIGLILGALYFIYVIIAFVFALNSPSFISDLYDYSNWL